jgi:hypothetical protein
LINLKVIKNIDSKSKEGKNKCQMK